jgi:hypothetical protein
MTETYSVTPNKVVNAPNGIDYAYRVEQMAHDAIRRP